MRTKNPFNTALLFSFLLFFTILPLSVRAAVFNVTTVDELRLAHKTTGMNGEDDLINISAGAYETDSDTFAYEPAVTEDFSLEISGAGADLTILNGGGVDQVLCSAVRTPTSSSLR